MSVSKYLECLLNLKSDLDQSTTVNPNVDTLNTTTENMDQPSSIPALETANMDTDWERFLASERGTFLIKDSINLSYF